MNTKEYLEAVKTKTGIDSDYKLAKLLNLTKQAISKYQLGNRVMDDYTAAKIAEVLEIPAIRVIADANAEREKDEKKRNYWEELARQSHAVALVMSLFLGGFMVSDSIDAKSPEYTLCAMLWILCVVFLVWSVNRAQAPD